MGLSTSIATSSKESKVTSTDLSIEARSSRYRIITDLPQEALEKEWELEIIIERFEDAKGVWVMDSGSKYFGPWKSDKHKTPELTTSMNPKSGDKVRVSINPKSSIDVGLTMEVI
jgi:hypothetical protein